MPPRPSDPDVSTAFGRALAAARKRRRLTQAELEELAQLTPGSVGRYERGQREPIVSIARRMAEALGTSAGRLMDEMEHELRAERARQVPEEP